ncbi:MAG: NUDIX domain-containing protein [Dehalococcoidia bacterium]|nr:NUDIX domain-containing protein [Dehalococcoidia bacterium]
MNDQPARREVVTCFLRRTDARGEARVLIVRRSGRVGTYRGRWSAISGYLEAETPLDQAMTEISEETGLGNDDVTLVAAGEPLPVDDAQSGLRWLVYPFLFDMASGRDVELDWENVEGRWVAPEELSRYDTVPALEDALRRVWPSGRTRG